MLVESTQSINRFAGDLGVSARATSLSSSPAKPNRSQTKAVLGEGEPSPEETRIEDQVTLSEVAEAKADDAVHEDRLSLASTQRDASVTDLDDKPGANQKIKQSIKSTQDTEREKLTQIAEDVTGRLDDSLSLRFSQDKETGTDIFQLVEPETGDVVRQIPAEEVLEFMKKFEKSVSGLFISQQA